VNVLITDLGLAAYIKISGMKLVKYEKGFIFESEDSEDCWRVKYLNSESYKHDTELMSLRRFLKK
jgi:hypothetical protein